MSEPFSAKLNLVLKALVMSRGRLAAELGVDKSLVGRWASGAVTPSAHNLANLTALVGRKREGFTLLDWDRDLEALAQLFGVQPHIDAQASRGRRVGLPGLPFGMVEAARKESAARAGAYHGHYRVTRLSAMRPGLFIREHLTMRPCEEPLEAILVGNDRECRGWLLSYRAQLYGMLADADDDGPAFMLLNGVSLPRAMVIDGIYSTVSLDRGQTPFAQIVVLERIADLADSPAEDERIIAAAKQRPALLQPEDVDPRVRAHILRDFGPGALANGGDVMLRIDWRNSLAEGAIGDEPRGLETSGATP